MDSPRTVSRTYSLRWSAYVHSVLARLQVSGGPDAHAPADFPGVPLSTNKGSHDVDDDNDDGDD